MKMTRQHLPLAYLLLAAILLFSACRITDHTERAYNM